MKQRRDWKQELPFLGRWVLELRFGGNVYLERQRGEWHYWIAVPAAGGASPPFACGTLATLTDAKAMARTGAQKAGWLDH